MHYPQKKAICCRIKESQVHLSSSWWPSEVAKVCRLVKVLQKCAPHRPGKVGSRKPYDTPTVGVPWTEQRPESLQTCFESGVRRFRLAVDMVREILIPANWRLLLPKMLDNTLLGGCEIKQQYFSFWFTGGHTVDTSVLFLFATSPDLHLPTLIRHMKKIVPRMN